MTVNSISIDGFGCLVDKYYDLSEGINTVYGCNESGKTTFVGFIQAILFGFREDGAGPAERSGVNSPEDRRPERAAFRPWSGAPYGGAISFCEAGRTYGVQAQWGNSPAEDRVVLKADGDEPVLLAPGETVCARIYGLSGADGFVLTSAVPDEHGAAAQAARLETLTLSRARTSGGTAAASPASVSSDPAPAAASAAAAPSSFIRGDSSQETRARGILDAALSRLSNAEGTGILQLEELREQELISQLKDSARIEAKAGELADAAKKLGAEKAAAETGEVNIPDFDRLKSNIALSRKAEEAEALSTEIADLQTQADEEFQASQHKKRPLYIALWVLLVLDALALAAVLLPADKIPALSGILEPLAAHKFVLFPVLALVFILLMVGLIATSTGGLTRYNALTEELQYRRRQLGDLLELDPDGADGDPEIFDEAAALALTELSNRAAQAELETKAASELHSSGMTRGAALTELSEKLSGAAAARDTLYAELSERQPYNVLEDELVALRQKLASHRREYAALQTAERLISRAGDYLSSDFLPRLSDYGSRALSALTAGRRNEFSYTDRFEPLVADNGVLRSSSLFHGCAHAQIMLAANMAVLSLLRADGASAPLLLVLDEPFSAYDNSNRRQALMVLKEYAAANDVQLIFTTSSAELIMDGTVRI